MVKHEKVLSTIQEKKTCQRRINSKENNILQGKLPKSLELRFNYQKTIHV